LEKSGDMDMKLYHLKSGCTFCMIYIISWLCFPL